MAPLSFAQSLRVIGQDLEGLGVKAFALARHADEYIVRLDWDGPDARLREKTLVKRIAGKLHRTEDSQVAPLRFTTAQIISSDIERSLRRGESTGVPDSANLSLILRVLGNFLDERGAADFAISWSGDGARVNYDRKAESFTTENLYDLGVRMYLRRSDRASAKNRPMPAPPGNLSNPNFRRRS